MFLRLHLTVCLGCRSQGALGYFPTYTLGAAFAVQLFRQIEKEMPTMHEDIANGKFTAIRKWLREKVCLDAHACISIQCLQL